MPQEWINQLVLKLEHWVQVLMEHQDGPLLIRISYKLLYMEAHGVRRENTDFGTRLDRFHGGRAPRGSQLT